MTLLEQMARAACHHACLRFAHDPNNDIECLADSAKCDSWETEIGIVRAALAEAEKQGWVLVPKDPTEAMINAGDDDIAQCDSDGVWLAMIAARPKL